MILLATICINEVQHIETLYQQHKNWPYLLCWVFVESADRVYADTNPSLVTSKGLSVDGTSQLLEHLSSIDPRVVYIPLGFSSHHLGKDQGKVFTRQAYVDVAHELKPRPEFIYILDADEYYTYQAQDRIYQIMKRKKFTNAFMFRQRHIFRPPSISNNPLFEKEVIGGYWQVPHIRGWLFEEGIRYNKNHNWLEDKNGYFLNHKTLQRYENIKGTPECIHLGYASSIEARKAKHQYYIARGEGSNGDRKRMMYVECRKAFEEWQPNQPLPHGAKVIPYNGEIPEVFIKENSNEPRILERGVLPNNR